MFHAFAHTGNLADCSTGACGASFSSHTSLKGTRDDLDAEIEELERGLKDAYTLSGMAGNWINADAWRFRVSQHPGRRTLNRDMLRLELLDALGDEQAAEKLISWCEVQGKPYTRLTVNPIN